MNRTIISRLKVALLVAAVVYWSLAAASAEQMETRFTRTEPNAKSVLLAGEFNHWSKTATRR